MLLQVCNSYSMQAVDYAASGRVVAVPAFQIQARRWECGCCCCCTMGCLGHAGRCRQCAWHQSVEERHRRGSAHARPAHLLAGHPHPHDPQLCFCCSLCRLARIIRSPIVSVISNMLTDFRSDAHIAIHEYPQLVGLPFRALHFHFPCERC